MIITQQEVDKAEKQIFTNQQEVAYDTREFTIELLVSKYLKDIETENNELYVPEYQREFVWDKERQSKFIESIILGLPIPFIFVAEMDSGRLEIVDGSQRIRTLAKFLNNELILKKMDMLTSLENFTFKDLSIPRQRKFKNSVIRMVVLSDKTTEKVRTEMFKRINRGSDVLNNMEVRKGLMKGDFRDFIYSECSEVQLFKDLCLLTPLAKDRQEPQELILRFFAFIDNYPNYKPRLSKFLDDYLEDKNNRFNESEKIEKFSQFNNMLEFVHKYFPTGFVKPNNRTKYVSKIYFESVSVGVALALKDNPQLLHKEKVNVKWLDDPEFIKIIEPRFNTHSPKGIVERVNFVKNSLLGLNVNSVITDIFNEDEED